MSLPIIAGAVGIGALLFAGSKEKAPSADGGGASSPSGATATPTTQSTGGENGGAQVPSHSDVAAGGGEVNTNVGGRGETNEGYLTAPTAPASSSSGPVAGLASGFASGYEAAGDSWAQPSGSPGLGQVGVVGGMTTRAIGDTFKAWGEAVGAIW